MKMPGLTYWGTPNGDANNSSGFSSIASGIRDNNGSFIELGQSHSFHFPEISTRRCYTYHVNGSFVIGDRPGNEAYGHSIRLIQQT
jgi:hypothetical protein